MLQYINPKYNLKSNHSVVCPKRTPSDYVCCSFTHFNDDDRCEVFFPHYRTAFETMMAPSFSALRYSALSLPTVWKHRGGDSPIVFVFALLLPHLCLTGAGCWQAAVNSCDAWSRGYASEQVNYRAFRTFLSLAIHAVAHHIQDGRKSKVGWQLCTVATAFVMAAHLAGSVRPAVCLFELSHRPVPSPFPFYRHSYIAKKVVNKCVLLFCHWTKWLSLFSSLWLINAGNRVIVGNICLLFK